MTWRATLAQYRLQSRMNDLAFAFTLLSLSYAFGSLGGCGHDLQTYRRIQFHARMREA